MNYHGNFQANGTTRFSTDLISSNKNKLLKDFRESALAERFDGSQASWHIDDENGKTVYEGRYIPQVGIRYSVYNYKVMDR